MIRKLPVGTARLVRIACSRVIHRTRVVVLGCQLATERKQLCTEVEALDAQPELDCPVEARQSLFLVAPLRAGLFKPAATRNQGSAWLSEPARSSMSKATRVAPAVARRLES